MHELTEIVRLLDDGEPPRYLATVVDVDGSAYRRPGARLAFDAAGRRAGSISGGCLERELIRTAATLTAAGAAVVTYDGHATALHPYGRHGQGCRGLIHLLVERVGPGRDDPLAVARQVVASGRPAALGTVWAASGPGMPAVGRRFASPSDPGGNAGLSSGVRMIESDVRSRTPLGKPAVPPDTRPRHLLTEAIRRDVAAAEAHRGAASVRYTLGDAWCEVLIERLDPPPPLLIFGAGDDARPLAGLADVLGWRVSVFDGRPEDATAARFPTAARRVVGPATEWVRELGSDVRAGDERTAAVLMTHSVRDDATILPALLRAGVGYIGLLGPKRRTAQVFLELARRGESLPPEGLARVRTPVGLDLGGSTPAEVAASIVAEIVAFRNGRRGGPLADRRDAIHDPPAHRLVDLDRPAATPGPDGRAARVPG